MQEEIRVMTLIRKSGIGKNVKSYDKDRFFTTDYFDLLNSRKEAVETPLSQWMCGSADSIDNSGETAVQSFPLYFSEHVYEKYEKGQEMIKRSDPFQNDDAFKFLSVIQVYITPEIMKRLKNKTDVIWNENQNEGILDIFFDDLYDTVERFRSSHSDQKFAYRIYYALSAGDFAIVVKSQTPELSFGISSYIRSRCSGKKWAIYKTYTLLAFENDIKNWEKDATRLSKDNTGKFILRGSYSCKYWAENAGSANINGIDRLNGRYDVSSELSEQEFGMLYRKYWDNYRNDKELLEQASDKVKHISGLIDKGYLSYINERYLMNGIEISVNDADIISKITLEDNVEQELYSLNKEIINDLRKRLCEIEKDFGTIYWEHKSIKHYFSLLKRQIGFCSVLNEQSDTRIYAHGMEMLLRVLLNSLAEYKELHHKKTMSPNSDDENQLGLFIVEYLGKAVYSINVYMEYVRNNNLQSLQTPNYNIESDMGMEKILIGYSEYIKEFICFYVKNNECMSNSIKFLPIIVPDISSADINVEVLFPDSNLFDLDVSPDRIKQESREKLLIISSPSMMELEDIPMAMAMLSHEIAHQFRYEDRTTRDTIILKLFAADCAEMIVNKMIVELETELDEIISFPPIINLLKEEWANIIVDFLSVSEYKINLEAPLDYLARQLSDNFLQFFNDFSYTSKLRKYIELFIRQVNEWVNIDINSTETIEKFHELLKKTKSDKSYIGEIEKIAQNYINDLVDKADPDEVILVYLDEFMKQILSESNGRLDNTSEKYIEHLYEKLTKEWKEKSQEHVDKVQKIISVNDYRMWELAGRYFGLDTEAVKNTQIYKKNKQKFVNIIRRIKITKEDLEIPLVDISTYREITSDIFMCCIMDLTPFAYLNIIVTGMWRSDLITNQDTLKRIITVIFIMCAKNDVYDSDHALEIYNNCCLELLEKTGTEIETHMPDEFEEFNKLVKDIADILNNFDDNSDKNLIGLIEDFCKKLGEKFAHGEDIYIKIDRLLLIFKGLFREGESVLKEWIYRNDKNDFLKKDLFKAYKCLSEFKQKMNSNIKMRQFDSLHEKISHYLERLYETGKAANSDLNRESIEFLLKMYYNYKFQNVGSGEG